MKFLDVSEHMTKRKLADTVKPVIRYLIDRGGTISIRYFPYLHIQKNVGKLSHRLRKWNWHDQANWLCKNQEFAAYPASARIHQRSFEAKQPSEIQLKKLTSEWMREEYSKIAGDVGDPAILAACMGMLSVPGS